MVVYAYDSKGCLARQIVDGSPIDYEYDAAGRLVREGDKTYRYGYLDKVMSVRDGKNTFTYTYHPDGQLASANYGVTSAVDLWGCELKVVDITTESVPYEPSHLHDKGIHTHIGGEYDGRKCHWYVIDLYERDVVVLQDYQKKRKWEAINGLENILNGMGYGLDISGGCASLTGVGIVPAGGLLLGGVLCHTAAEIVNLLNSWVEVPLGKPITLKGEPYKKDSFELHVLE